MMTKVTSGALPYSDGSGFGVEISIDHAKEGTLVEIKQYDHTVVFPLSDLHEVMNKITDTERAFRMIHHDN